MRGVIESYEEEIVVAPQKRFVHVVVDVSARIEAWHGGRMVTELGGWTSLTRATSEADYLAKRFGVAVGSTMSIIVREEISWQRVVGDKVDLDHRGETIGRKAVVSDRYVYDAVLGDLAPSWRTVSFEWTMPILFGKATDWPGQQQLAQFFRPLAIQGWGKEFLYSGYGYRNMQISSRIARQARPGEMPNSAMDRKQPPSPSQCWVVVITGTIEISTPKDRSPADVIADLDAQRLDVDIELDQARDGGRMNRDRWSIWTGSPAAKMVWKDAEST